jgi:hypothetical protein
MKKSVWVLFPIFIISLAGCNRSFEAGYVSDGSNGSQGSGGGGGGTAPNPTNKESVRAAYNAEFSGTWMDPQWTGDFNSCNPGTTSLQFQQTVINRISFYRQLVGLPAVQLVPNLGDYQAAALIMGANGQLSHSPPSTWKCFSQSGSSGAGSSNLALGTYGSGAIDMYMDDFGGNNSAVGHRRWILNSSRTHFATGDVPGGSGGQAANSLSVWQAAGSDPGLNVVAWPPAGYVPKPVLPSGSQRWSFATRLGGLNAATVRMRNLTTGQNLNASLEPFSTGFGEATLVWLAPDVNYHSPAEDTVYEVTIENIQTGSGATSYTYRVIVFDP